MCIVVHFLSIMANPKFLNEVLPDRSHKHDIEVYT